MAMLRQSSLLHRLLYEHLVISPLQQPRFRVPAKRQRPVERFLIYWRGERERISVLSRFGEVQEGRSAITVSKINSSRQGLVGLNNDYSYGRFGFRRRFSGFPSPNETA